MSKVQLSQEWEAKVAEFNACGQTQAAWCRERNINLITFNRCVFGKIKTKQSGT